MVRFELLQLVIFVVIACLRCPFFGRRRCSTSSARFFNNHGFFVVRVKDYLVLTIKFLKQYE